MQLEFDIQDLYNQSVIAAWKVEMVIVFDD